MKSVTLLLTGFLGRDTGLLTGGPKRVEDIGEVDRGGCRRGVRPDTGEFGRDDSTGCSGFKGVDSVH